MLEKTALKIPFACLGSIINIHKWQPPLISLSAERLSTLLDHRAAKFYLLFHCPHIWFRKP